MLPLAELLVAAVVAGPPAVQMLHSPPYLHRATTGKIIIDMADPAVQRWLAERRPRFPSRFEDVWYLNVPALLVEIAIDLPTAWPDYYRPAWSWPLGLDGYRALTWPIWALPLWFFAGRGLDSLFRRYKITGAEAFFIGSFSFLIALFTILAVICGGLQSVDERYQIWELLPLAMWFGFGVICQIAWWRQRKEHKAARAITTQR